MLAAIAILAAAHLVVTHLPHPVLLRDRLARKVIALTRNAKPSVVIAGDSRALGGLNPTALARALDVPWAETISIAQSESEPAAFRAAFETYRDRFAPQPVFILNLTATSVDDSRTAFLGMESIQRMSWSQRIRNLGLTDALASLTLPERSLWEKLLRHTVAPIPAPAEQGFSNSSSPTGITNWSAATRTQRARAVIENWFSDAMIDGYRWELMKQDLTALKASNAQPVVVAMPLHPRLLAELATAEDGSIEVRLRRKLDRLCRKLQIPYLDYAVSDLPGIVPDRAFKDMIHLTRQGAEVLTVRLAGDLQELDRQGRIVLPDLPRPASP